MAAFETFETRKSIDDFLKDHATRLGAGEGTYRPDQRATGSNFFEFVPKKQANTASYGGDGGCVYYRFHSPDHQAKFMQVRWLRVFTVFTVFTPWLRVYRWTTV
jgi:hypothetical protein